MDAIFSGGTPVLLSFGFQNELRVETRSRNSLLEQGHRGSHSTLNGKRGHPAMDDLNRPVDYEDNREYMLKAEECQRRMELKSSNMSVDSGITSSLVPVKPQQDEYAAPNESDLGLLQERDSPLEGDLGSYNSTEEEEEGNRQYIASALSRCFYTTDGTLRPKPHSNAIVLQLREQII